MNRSYSLTVILGADEDPTKTATMIREALASMKEAEIFNVSLCYDEDGVGCDLYEDVICGRMRLSAACIHAPEHDGPCSFETPKGSEPTTQDANGWRPARVEIVGLVGPYDAMVKISEDHNGAVIPCFTFAVVEQLGERLFQNAELLGPQEIADVVYTVGGTVDVRYSYGEPDETAEIIEPNELGMYEVGARVWRWELAD
jgi:hypothetical protein